MVRRVETALDDLKQADRLYWSQTLKRQRISKACNEAAKEVQPVLVEVRRAIELRFGRLMGRKVHGLKGNTLRKPTRLFPQLGSVVQRLRDQETLPEPKRPGPSDEREQWLAMLEPGLAKLYRLLEQRRQAELHEAVLREERDTELEYFDFVYGDAVAFMRAVYWVVGYGDRLVDVRPRNDRRRRIRKARLESEARVEGRRKTRS